MNIYIDAKKEEIKAYDFVVNLLSMFGFDVIVMDDGTTDKKSCYMNDEEQIK